MTDKEARNAERTGETPSAMADAFAAVQDAIQRCDFPTAKIMLDGLEKSAIRLELELAEKVANEQGYEQIIGPKSYQEVADEIAMLKGLLGAANNALAHQASLLSAKDLELLSATLPTKPVAWVVAVGGFEEGTLRVYGPQYTSRESAERDAALPRARGEKAEVWECYACTTDRTAGRK